jgi:superfamily II DNA or RNA helicase
MEKRITDIVLKIGNLASQVVTKDKDLLHKLHNKFKFQDKAFFFKRKFSPFPRYQMSEAFFDRHGKFPTGLLAEVTSELRALDLTFDRLDLRPQTKDPPKYLEVTSDFLKTNTSNIMLHDYQVEVANLALKEQRGIIKCATGGGKTLIFTALLKALENKYPAVILMRNKSLVEQTYQVFKQNNLPNVGRVNMDFHEPNHITCATIQSLHKIEDLIPKAKVLIIDEVHEFASKKTIQQFKNFDNTVFRWGFSATPFKKDDEIHNYRLKSWLGPQLCDITMEQLQEHKILSGSEAHFYQINEPSDIKGLQYFEAEDQGIVKNEYFHKKVAELVNKIPSGRILVMVKRLQHGDYLHDLLPGSFWIKGQDDAETREFVFNQLRHSEKEKVVAICSSIGYLGINIYVHHIINASGGKDPNVLIQKIGRGLRKSHDKDKLEYHDFKFNNHPTLMKHSLHRIKTLKSEGHLVNDDVPI